MKRKLLAVKECVGGKIISGSCPLIFVYDIDRFSSTIKEVKSSFPSNFSHTMALKANPLKPMMKIANDLGIGFEAASLGELSLAIDVSNNPSRDVVFDSPVKTVDELKYAIKNNVTINCDNLQEIDRVISIVNSNDHFDFLDELKIGVRINTQIGAGKLHQFSTSSASSKFGIPLNEQRDRVKSLFMQHRWLSGLHVHVGSQGCAPEMIIRGIRLIVDLALEIDSESLKTRNTRQIKYIDIGGGLSVNFGSEDETEGTISFSEFSSMLKLKCPELFPEAGFGWRIITEYGRRYSAKSGFYLSLVEYTKVPGPSSSSLTFPFQQAGGHNIATIHAGVETFQRTCFFPKDWPLRISVFDGGTGELKQGQETSLWDIAGPCCNAADVIAWERPLPPIFPGDIVMVHDTGAYTHSQFSLYNLRQMPPVYGFFDVKGMELLRKGQTIQETMSFFS